MSTLQKPLLGNAYAKRRQWGRNCRVGQELRFSTKTQKRRFQRQFRNGKSLDCPRKGNYYRKLGKDAKWDLVS